MNATEESVMLLHVSSFSPLPSDRILRWSVWVVVLDLRLLVSVLLPRSLAAGGSGEDPRDFRVGPGITSTKSALQSNNARPGLRNSSAVSSTAQIPYQRFKVSPFTRLDHEGRNGGLTSGDES